MVQKQGKVVASFEMTIDPKGRLVLPKAFRCTGSSRESAAELTLSQSIGLGIDAWMRDLFNVFVSGLRRSNTTPERDFIRHFFSSARSTNCDKMGRISLPDDLRWRSNLARKAAILCLGSRARILPLDDWLNVRRNPNSIVSEGILRSLMVMCRSMAELPGHVIERVERVAHDLLTTRVRSVDPHAFERVVAEALENEDVGVIELTQPSKDRGIDVIVYVPSRLGTFVMFVECKSGSRRTGVGALRELIGVAAREGASSALLVARSGFTRGVADEVSVSRLQVSAVESARLSHWVEQQMVSWIIGSCAGHQ